MLLRAREAGSGLYDNPSSLQLPLCVMKVDDAVYQSGDNLQGILNKFTKKKLLRSHLCKIALQSMTLVV